MFTLKRIHNGCVFLFLRYLYRKRKGCQWCNCMGQKVNNNVIIHDSNNGTSAFGSTHISTDTDSHDVSSSSNANINKIIKQIKTNQNMNKKNTIRLTESDLKRVIT